MSVRNLWRNVQLAWRYRLHRLRRQDIDVRIPAARVPDCARCTDSCCKGPHLVSLRLSDMARLCDAGLGWAMVAPNTRNRQGVYDKSPALRHIESRDSFALFPVLDHTPEGKCVFLSNNDRCTIYRIRPLACRRFPYRVSDDLAHIDWANGCRSWCNDGSGTTAEAMIEDTINSYNEKLRDLVFLQYGRPEIREIGLDPYIPNNRGTG